MAIRAVITVVAALACGCSVQVNTASPATTSTTPAVVSTAPPDELMSMLNGVPIAAPEAHALAAAVCMAFIERSGTAIPDAAKQLAVHQSWTPLEADQFIRAAVAVSCPRFVNGS